MLFLRNKKHKKVMNAVWTVIVVFIIVSFIGLYITPFFGL